MGITSKTIAPFVAAAFSVEGEYSEFEKEVVAGLAEDLELKDLEKEVAAAFKKIESLEDEDFDNYLAEAAKGVKASKEAVLLVTLDVLAADSVITSDEIENYFAFAEVLGVADDKASEIFDEYVENTEDLEIEA